MTEEEKKQFLEKKKNEFVDKAIKDMNAEVNIKNPFVFEVVKSAIRVGYAGGLFDGIQITKNQEI